MGEEMERLLAHAIIWRCFDGWPGRFNDALNERLVADADWSPQLMELALASGSCDGVWRVFSEQVIPRFDSLDVDAFKCGLVGALEGLYRECGEPLAIFASVAYPVWCLLAAYGLESDDLSELCFADDYLASDGAAAARACYEELFARFR